MTEDKSKEVTTTEPERLLGIYDNMDFEDYKKAKAMNNSGLKLFHESPATYIDDKFHPAPTTHLFFLVAFEYVVD